MCDKAEPTKTRFPLNTMSNQNNLPWCVAKVELDYRREVATIVFRPVLRVSGLS